MCVHEQTKDRISITAYLGKLFGMRIFNAMLVPYVISRASSYRMPGTKANAPRRLFVICMFNHSTDDELDALLEGSKSASGCGHENIALKYANFDPKT